MRSIWTTFHACGTVVVLNAMQEETVEKVAKAQAADFEAQVAAGLKAGTQEELKRMCTEILDTEQQNANTARLTISRHMAPFGPDPHLIAGDWVASGVNAFKNGEIETERFTIEVQEDGSLSGRATDPDAAGSGQDYTLDNVAIKPHPQDDSLVVLEFHQVRVCTPARMFLERRN